MSAGAPVPTVMHPGPALSAMLDGELSGPEEAVVQEHLRTCGPCRDEIDAVRLARSWVRAMPAVEPPFGFLERLRSQSRRPPRRRTVAATIGAVAAVVATVVGITPERRPSPAVNPNLASVNADPLSSPTGLSLVSRTTASTMASDPMATDPLAPVGR